MRAPHHPSALSAMPALLALLLCSGCAVTSSPVPPPVPPHARAVVFDIDGTLTPTPNAIFSVRPDAAEAVRRHAARGDLVIYLSARARLFQFNIPGWLRDNGFPPGPLHLPAGAADSDNRQAFKQRVLDDYRRQGWTLVAGYGDSSTDFAAYAHAGIAPSRVFALRRVGDAACQPGIWQRCLAGWAEQLPVIDRFGDD